MVTGAAAPASSKHSKEKVHKPSVQLKTKGTTVKKHCKIPIESDSDSSLDSSSESDGKGKKSKAKSSRSPSSSCPWPFRWSKPQPGESSSSKLSKWLCYSFWTTQYPQIIICLAIVDIIVAIFVLSTWAVMVFILWLIFTADRKRCNSVANENKFDRAHLEMYAVVLYIIQPVFYSISLLTAVTMALAMEKHKMKVEDGEVEKTEEILKLKRKCLLWILASFLHCLELEFILFIIVIKYDAILIPLIFYAFHFVFKISSVLIVGRFLVRISK